uniref:Putative nucleocapsid n=1 Tax=Old quarry swamp virus TaxID=2485876 RepID=A0A3G3BTH0_9VIRU|nr:putative nucleocapsid [Old quarry swamp virus]
MQKMEGNKTPMEVEPVPGTSAGSASTADTAVPRKVVVDADNTSVEVANPQKNNYVPEKEKKKKVILFIANAHLALAKKLGVSDFMNINVGDQVHNISFTAHTILRQRRNQTGGNLENKIAGTDFKITIGGAEHSLTREEAYKIVETSANQQGLTYAKFKPGDEANWYGIAGPIYNFLSGHALRRKELRLGHNTMTHRKVGQREEVIELKQYGIYGAHHPLCEGVSFPPEKKASMAQSMGPLTALLCYARAEKAYSAKWLAAAKRALAHLPEIDTVLSMIKEKQPSEVKPLITLLANICLITTTRQATRMYPPPAAFAYIFNIDKYPSPRGASKEKLLEVFDFSGHGAFCFYSVFQEFQWKLCGTGLTDTIARQIVYHSMFGTFKEDFGILSAITNESTWRTREQMRNCFRQANTSGTPCPFYPIKQKYYAKMAQANQTGLLTASYSQVSSLPCFSGPTKRKYGDAFFEMLENQTGRTMGGKTLSSLVNLYSEVLDELRKKLEGDGKIVSMGTTKWRLLSEINVDFAAPVEKDECFITTGKFFLGKSE